MAKRDRVENAVLLALSRSSANYLHVKGIFDLWGSPGAWREGPWKTGVAAFTPSSFNLAIGERDTTRWQAFMRLASPFTVGKKSPALQKQWHRIWRPGAERGWFGRVGDGGGGEVRGAAEYKGDGRENAVSSP